MKVLAERDSGAYDATQVEDGPEDTNEKAFLVLRWIRQHKRALGCPEQSCTDSKDGTSDDNKGTGM